MPLARKDLNIWPTKQEIAVRKFDVQYFSENQKKYLATCCFCVSFSIQSNVLLMNDENCYKHDNFIIQSKSH